ncbi:MAG TPA: hypothetical protein VIV60_26405 [Polyangiaceae bacterium]
MTLNHLNWSTLVALSCVALMANNGCDPNQQIIGDSPTEGGSFAATGGASGVLGQGGAMATGGVSLSGGALGSGGAMATGGVSLSGGALGSGGAMATGGASSETTCTYQGNTYPVGAAVGLCLCLPDGSIGHCLGALPEGGSSSVGSGGTGASGGVAGGGAAPSGSAGVAGFDTSDPRVRSCLDNGGVLTTVQCCANPTVTDFTSMCATGPCGCALEHSKPIVTCRCPLNQCFDGTTCIPSR